jgi:hypothetical protein
MSHDDDRAGRTFCDVCESRWRDEDRDQHMVGIAQLGIGPGGGVLFVGVDHQKARVHICNYCLKEIAKLANEQHP